jgi:hypothetical protein
MFELNEQGFDVTWHADATATICIVPFDIDTRKLISGHVELDPVEFLENVQEVVEALKPIIFTADISSARSPIWRWSLGRYSLLYSHSVRGMSYSLPSNVLHIVT